MSNFVKELEQDASNFANQDGGNQQSGGFGANDNQSSGNFGGNDRQGGDSQQGGSDNQQQESSGNSSGKGSGGFMSSMENTGKDAMVDQEVNSFMTKEGVPQGADGMVDNFVNQEFNKYS